MFGYKVRCIGATSSPSPIVVLFHTAAGPHDLFLLYKAAQIAANNFEVWIADLYSDESGWAWSDTDRKQDVREKLMENNRALLNRRIEAVMDQVDVLVNDSNNSYCLLGAMGWCLGGHCIAQLATTTHNKVPPAMVTFHGVFRGLSADNVTAAASKKKTQSVASQVLLCHGVDDPFVSSQDLETVLYVSYAYYCACFLTMLCGYYF